MQLLVLGNGIGLDIFADRFIDIALTELGITPAGPMPNQLVGERARYPRKQQIPDRVLQNRSVTNLEDVTNVAGISSWTRLRKAHVANAPGRLNEVFSGNFGIGLPGNAM